MDESTGKVKQGEMSPDNFGMEFRKGKIIMHLPSKTTLELVPVNENGIMNYRENPARGAYVYGGVDDEITIQVTGYPRDSIDDVESDDDWGVYFEDGEIVIIFPAWADEESYRFVPMTEYGAMDFVEVIDGHYYVYKCEESGVQFTLELSRQSNRNLKR